MKLKSKNSFLKRISCIALSLMLCLTSFTLAGFAPTLEAEAAIDEVLHYTFDNGSLVDANGQNQLSEITWGSTSNSTDYYYNSDGGVYGTVSGLNGLNNWKLTYIGSSNQDLESAKQEGSCDFGLGTSVGNTDVIRVSSYGHIYSNETLLVQASVTSQQVTTIVFEYTDKQLVVTVNDVSYGPFTVKSDLFQNVNSMYTGINSGKGIGSHRHYVYDIVATNDNSPVSDTSYQVFGNVTLDPIIYTHGSYSSNPQYDYMMIGKYISDGTYSGECKTNVFTKKTIASVDVIGSSNANVGVYNGVLKGNLGDSFTTITDSSVTLKFNFVDNTYEYHRLPVKTNPVERHFVTGTFGWHLTGYRRLIAYQVLANGSYSNVQNTASATISSSTDSQNIYNQNVNFASIYNPFNSTYRFIEKDFTGALSGVDKIGGTCINFFYKKNKDREIFFTTQDPAIYYLDLSSSTNRGINHTASNSDNSSGSYSFTINLNNVQYYSSNKDSTNNPQAGSKTLESSSSEKGSTVEQIKSTLPDTIESGSSDSSTGGTLTLGGTAIAGDTIKGEYEFTYGDYNYYYTWNNTHLPFVIYVSDKTTVRNNYNSKLDSLKSLDSRCYTTESWTALSNALLDFEEYLNDNTDTSSKSTETLDSAYNNLQKSTDVQNQHPSYTITQTVSPTCTEQGYDVITCSVCGQTQNINYTPAKGHSYSGIYAPTYSAGNSYNETSAYTHSRSCADCGYVDTQTCTFVNQGVNGDTATVTCSVCGGTYALDYTAYNAELKVLDGMLAETNKYSNTEACKSERNSVNDSATSSESDIRTQDDVDAKINELKEIENKLTLKKYSITFNVATVDGKTLATNITGTGTYDYGTMVELDLPEQYQTNYVVTTWKRYAKGEDKVVGATSTKLYVVVNQESTYTAVINSVATGTVGENQAVLTLNNKSGKTVDVGIVDTNQEQTVIVNIADSKIKIGSVELTAPTYSFYTLKGFYIDKTLYSESGGTVTITKDTVITPYYDASLFVNIKRASDESFTINNENIDLYPAKWNQKVTLKSETEVYWYNDNDVLLGKGTTYSFYANSNVTIHTKAVGSVENVAPTTSIGYFDYDSTLNKVTVVNNFFVPDGKTVTEAGVILSTKNSTVEALKAQSNGKFEGGTESFTSTGNQIRISVSRTANTPFTMYALAYVVVDGTTYYANEVKTINYTPQSA